jgi:integrase
MVESGGEAVWPSSSTADTAKSVKAGIRQTPVPVNSKRDGAAGKSARASFTSREHSPGSSTASKPANRTGMKRRLSLLPGKRLTRGTAKSSPHLPHREGAKIAHATLRKYKTFTKQLTAFADSRGYVMLDQFTSSDIDVFYGGWNLGARAKGKRLGTLWAFFRFCMNRKWLRENPVSADIKPPMGANRVANKAPHTDEELQRIIDTCDNLGEVAWANGRENGVYTGEDVKDFIWVMVYMGLRISDVGLFDMSRLRGNEVFLRAKKNGGDVFAYIPDWLRDRLNARAKRCGVRPFVVGHSDRLETVTDMWRRKIGKGVRAGRCV